MNKLILLFSLFLITAILSASDIMPIPNQDFLVKNNFNFSMRGLSGSDIKFFKDNKYNMGYMVGLGFVWYIEGNYEISGNNVLLHPSKCFQNKNGPEKNCKETIGETTCYLEKNNDSIFYSVYLKCKSKNNNDLIDSFEYPVEDSKIKAGETKKVDAIEVITTGRKSAVTTANVKIRVQPSVSAKEIEFRLYPDYRSPFIPEKQFITVFARTLKKEKVQNWENYWYYVEAGISGKAWIFGEFIKFNAE